MRISVCWIAGTVKKTKDPAVLVHLWKRKWYHWWQTSFLARRKRITLIIFLPSNTNLFGLEKRQNLLTQHLLLC